MELVKNSIINLQLTFSTKLHERFFKIYQNKFKFLKFFKINQNKFNINKNLFELFN